jgi:hypothetical protein
MRFVGVSLVVLGMVVLGYQGFTFSHDGKAGGNDISAREAVEPRTYLPPLVGGAAIIGGILLVTTADCRSGAASPRKTLSQI